MTTTSITEYSRTEAALADLAQKYKGVVFDVTTREGMQTAVKGRAELRTYRVNLEKTRVEIKGPALERCRLIDAEAKRITAELSALEERRKEAELADAHGMLALFVQRFGHLPKFAAVVKAIKEVTK